MPTEPAIPNGKSPIPPGVFRRSGLSPVTVHWPFLDRMGGVSGAILVKNSGPKQFLKQNRSVLRLLSSKTRDRVEIASLPSNADVHRIDDEIRRLIGKQFHSVVGGIFSRREKQFKTVRSRFPDDPVLVN